MLHAQNPRSAPSRHLSGQTDLALRQRANAWRVAMAATLIALAPQPALAPLTAPLTALAQQAWSATAPKLAEFELRMRLAAAPAPAPAQLAARGDAPRRVAAAPTDRGEAFHGRASYYGQDFAGLPTANGETFNPQALTMAHPSLPFGTLVRVTNPKNQESVVVRVNDRGPFIPGRVADLSRAAAEQLQMLRAGVARLRFEVLGGHPPERTP